MFIVTAMETSNLTQSIIQKIISFKYYLTLKYTSGTEIYLWTSVVKFLAILSCLEYLNQN
jgi:hypothetical protein